MSDTPNNGDRLDAEDEQPDEALDEDGEPLPDETPEEVGLVARLVGAVMGTVGNLFAGLGFMVTRFLPKSWRFWQGLAKLSYKNMLKTKSGGEAIGHIYRGSGDMEIVPMAYQEGKWITPGKEQEFEAAAVGQDTHRVGPVPTVFAIEDSPTLGSDVKARFAEALDLGRKHPIYTDADIDVILDAHPGEDTNSQAVADGGMNRDIRVNSRGIFRDKIVNIGSEPETDGMMVSAEKYYNAVPEKSAREEMERQEERGRIAERDPEARKSFAMKMLLIAGAIVIGALGIIFLGPQMLGGSGINIPM